MKQFLSRIQKPLLCCLLLSLLCALAVPAFATVNSEITKRALYDNYTLKSQNLTLSLPIGYTYLLEEDYENSDAATVYRMTEENMDSYLKQQGACIVACSHDTNQYSEFRIGNQQADFTIQSESTTKMSDAARAGYADGYCQAYGLTTYATYISPTNDTWLIFDRVNMTTIDGSTVKLYVYEYRSIIDGVEWKVLKINYGDPIQSADRTAVQALIDSMQFDDSAAQTTAMTWIAIAVVAASGISLILLQYKKNTATIQPSTAFSGAASIPPPSVQTAIAPVADAQPGDGIAATIPAPHSDNTPYKSLKTPSLRYYNYLLNVGFPLGILFSIGRMILDFNYFERLGLVGLIIVVVFDVLPLALRIITYIALVNHHKHAWMLTIALSCTSIGFCLIDYAILGGSNTWGIILVDICCLIYFYKRRHYIGPAGKQAETDRQTQPTVDTRAPIVVDNAPDKVYDRTSKVEPLVPVSAGPPATVSTAPVHAPAPSPVLSTATPSTPEHTSPVFCHYCGLPLVEDAVFCNKCGHPVVQAPAELQCAQCGWTIPTDSAFCPICGNQVSPRA